MPNRSERRHVQGSEPREHRTEYQRDRDRVLYSSAFRRLAGVTQVVHAAEGHVFHNRLTHTLKVAQIARRIAEQLISTQGDLASVVGVDPDVAETAALAHDLGHPPFGHIAEQELDSRMQNAGIGDGFEGNAQSFRIVTKVAIKNAEYKGLDLTRASLNAILKYPWARGVDGKSHVKWGHYFSEKEDFEFARQLNLPSDLRQSAEAAIMDWADDVTYSVHDVDDFYRAGLIPLDRLLSATDERSRFIEFAFDKWEKKHDYKPPREFTKTVAEEFFDLRRLSFMAGESEEGDLQVPFSGKRGQRQRLSTFSGFLIRRYVLGAKQTPAVTLVSSGKRNFVRIEPKLRAEVNLLKQLMQYYVFDHPTLVAQQLGQRRVIRELFDILFDAAKGASKNQGLIPPPFSDSLRDLPANATRERARLVCDLIASMTEQQSLTLHQRLTGYAPGSFSDLIIR
jgi:dGTPase